MSTKNVFLIVIVLLLAGLSLYLNKDRFGRPFIQIGHRFEHPHGALARRFGNSNTNILIFILDREVALTAVRVVAARDLESNPSAHAVWDLVSDSNSVPVKDLVYGMNIRGLRPATPQAKAEPLETGVKYRLLLQAGSRKGQHDFVAEAPAP
jgi:hypothetical protein